VHHKLEELLDQYLEMSRLRNRPTAPLFPIAVGKTRELGNRQAVPIDAARMLKRRLKDTGLPIIRLENSTYRSIPEF
jgi:hypothetical protein